MEILLKYCYHSQLGAGIFQRDLLGTMPPCLGLWHAANSLTSYSN